MLHLPVCASAYLCTCLYNLCTHRRCQTAHLRLSLDSLKTRPTCLILSVLLCVCTSCMACMKPPCSHHRHHHHHHRHCHQTPPLPPLPLPPLLTLLWQCRYHSPWFPWWMSSLAACLGSWTTSRKATAARSLPSCMRMCPGYAHQASTGLPLRTSRLLLLSICCMRMCPAYAHQTCTGAPLHASRLLLLSVSVLLTSGWTDFTWCQTKCRVAVSLCSGNFEGKSSLPGIKPRFTHMFLFPYRGHETPVVHTTHYSIPHPIMVFCTHGKAKCCHCRVLCMEWIDGVKLTDKAKMDAAGLEIIDFVDVGIECTLRQLLEHGYFHADPHPGKLH